MGSTGLGRIAEQAKQAGYQELLSLFEPKLEEVQRHVQNRIDLKRRRESAVYAF
ncbi:MAG: hypothetical protein WB579_12410 [Bryobacteraceae bacterium]